MNEQTFTSPELYETWALGERTTLTCDFVCTTSRHEHEGALPNAEYDTVAFTTPSNGFGRENIPAARERGGRNLTIVTSRNSKEMPPPLALFWESNIRLIGP